jgi:hypothetical protein
MGLFDRIKNMFSLTSSDGTSPRHHHREAADFVEEQAESDQSHRDGLLGPRTAMNSGLGREVTNDPTAAAELRTSVDREDDGSKEMLIQQERRESERGE